MERTEVNLICDKQYIKRFLVLKQYINLYLAACEWKLVKSQRAASQNVAEFDAM